MTWVAQSQRQGFLRFPGARLPLDLSQFFVGWLALVLQDTARWLA
jgi:hypothetical protein